VRSLFADEPSEVWAAESSSGDSRFREVPETLCCVLRFPDDRIATFTCSFGAAERSAYEVVGTKGSLRVDPGYDYAEELSYQLTLGGKTRSKKFARRDQFAAELLYFSSASCRGVSRSRRGAKV
jgi:glucose-fructose oxidoreductase